MGVMSSIDIDKSYGKPEDMPDKNKEYLDGIINGNALDEPMDLTEAKE